MTIDYEMSNHMYDFVILSEILSASAMYLRHLIWIPCAKHG